MDSGRVLSGFARDDVLEALARLFNQPPVSLLCLIDGPPIAIKRNVDAANADRYVERLRKIGVDRHVDSDTLNPILMCSRESRGRLHRKLKSGKTIQCTFLLGFITLLGIPGFAHGTQLSERQKGSFAKETEFVCIEKDKRDPIMSANMTRSQITEYCRCFGNQMSEVITVEDAIKVQQTNSSQHLRARMTAADASCAQILARKWGWTK